MRKQSVQTTLTFTEKDTPIKQWGDLIDTKDKNTFRIYFQNVNSIQPNQIERWDNIVETTFLKFKSDIVGLCETGLHWQKHLVRNKIKKVLNNNKHKHINIFHSQNSATSSTSFLPGGTLILTKDKWIGRIVQPLADPACMGRWTGAKYRVQDNRHLYIISAYRPCPSPPHHTLPQSNSTYAQQYFKLRTQGNQDPKPREQFVMDLIQYIQDLNLTPMDMVLVMFDANEQLGKEKNGIIQLIEKSGLVDLYTLHHNQACNIATQAKGSQRIDYMLGTPNILPYINKCGYLSFHDQIVTDHRGLFIDLSTTLLDVNVKRQVNSVREIGSNSTMTNTIKYKEYILKQFINHNIKLRSQDIFKQAGLDTTYRPLNFVAKLNQLDQQITDILLKAEKKYAVDPLQKWTTNADIRETYVVLKYWQVAISAMKHKKDFTESLEQLQETLSSENQEHIEQYKATPLLGLRKIKERLKEQKDLKLQEMRDQEATESAMIAQAENKTPYQVEKTREQTQYTKNIYNTLRARFRPPHTQGLTNVFVPPRDGDTDKEYDVITNPGEVEDTIITRNIQHFGQAQGTPFTKGVMTDEFGYTGVSKSATKLIQGQDMEALLDSVGPGEKKILRKLNDGENTPTMAMNISLKEFMNGFRKWREGTSTSPSGRHLGHYKALLRAELCDVKLISANPPQTKINAILNPKGQEIFKSIYNVAMAAMKAGETLERWRQVQSSMIEKDPGKPFIHRLRVIHLFEADYNLLLKILWSRKLTWKAHLDGTLHDAQAGSRPGKRAIDLVVFKEQKYLYARLTRTPLLTMDNDAKACYDRIICNLAMMTSQYFGMPDNACKMQAKTLQTMEFKLKTALGVSNKHYQHSEETPVHGSGQGSCASPTLWLLISTILMRCLDTGAPGMGMYPIQKIGKILRSIIDGFVDDTSLFANLPFHLSCMIQAIHNLQSATKTWAELLEASGGKLELSKCFYYVLNWKFDENGDPIPLTIAEQEQASIPKIQIQDTEQDRVIYIQQKESKCPHRTLGVFKNIIGEELHQYLILLQKSNELAQLVYASHMSKHQANLAFMMIYLPMISYCFAACSFTLEQMEKIQAKALERFLPAMGWRRTSARVFVHGPLELGGINIPHLYALQGAIKMMTFLNHVRCQTELGQVFILNINWLQLISGKGQHIFEDTERIPYIQDNWFTNLQEYMRVSNLHVKSSLFWVPQLLRRHDQFLMEAATTIQFPTKELRIVNNWRLYFQATRLSDLCDGSGKNIMPQYRLYDEVENWGEYRESKLHWPKQGKPGKVSFKIWRKFLERSFQMQPNGMISQKLESWLISPQESDTMWRIYYVPTEQRIYKKLEFNYATYRCTKTARWKSTFEHWISAYELEVPHQAVPATCLAMGVQGIDVSFQIDNRRGRNEREPESEGEVESPYGKGFLHYVTTRERWEQDLCSNWQSKPKAEIEPILKGLKGPIWMAVASAINLHSGSYMVVLGGEGNILFQNHGKIRCSTNEVDRTRVQWIALLSAVANIRLLLQYFNPDHQPEQECHISCGNPNMVNYLNKHKHEDMPIGMYGSKHIDVVLQILFDIKQLNNKNIMIHFHFSKREKPKTSELAPIQHAQSVLQKIAHELLKETRHEPAEAHDEDYEYPACHIMPYHHNAPIYKNVYRRVNAAYTAIPMCNYMMDKYKWTEDTMRTIWWTLFEDAIYKTPKKLRQTITKFNFDQWACNTREVHIHTHRTGKCELCCFADEDTDHVIKCTHYPRLLDRQERLVQLIQYIRDIGTPENVITCFWFGIQSWLTDTAPPDTLLIVPDASERLQQAYHDQQTIGWRHFFRGRWAIAWRLVIQDAIDYGDLPGPPIKKKIQSPEVWGRKVVHACWRAAVHLWNGRNVSVQKLYTDRGLNRAHELLVQDAVQETIGTEIIARQDEDWIQKTEEELRALHPLSLQFWIQNIRKLKNWYRSHEKAEQSNELL